MEMKRTNGAVFTNGTRKIVTSRIGMGMFWECFQEHGREDSVLLLERSPGSDNSKWIMKDASQFEPHNAHLPDLARLETVGDKALWQMDYYPTVTAKDKGAWADLKLLMMLRDNRWKELASEPNYLAYGNDLIYRVASDLHEHPSLRAALEAIAAATANYGNGYTVEFAKRNCGVSKTGHLILRDCVFDLQEVHRRHREALKRSRSY